MEFPKIATIIGILIFSSIESTTSSNERFPDTPFDIFLATNRNTANISQSTENTGATSIPPAEPVIVKNTDAGDSCSLLDLSVGKLPLDSKFMVFRNFSYDGNTFCLKWTIVGDLTDVKSCVIKYTFKRGTKHVRVKCPSVNSEIITWVLNEEIYKICLDIYAPMKMGFCNYTLYGRTTALVSETTTLAETASILQEITTSIVSEETTLAEATSILQERTTSRVTETSALAETTSILQDSTTRIITETTPFKEAKTVRFTEDSTDNKSDYITVVTRVYSNSSNKTSDTFLRTEPSTASTTQSAKHTATTSIPFRELATVGAPLICFLILLIIVVVIIIFKNIKTHKSKRYDVLDEDDKYYKRTKLRSQTTRDQSIKLSYLARENFDDV